MFALSQTLGPHALRWLRRSYAIGFLALVSVAAFTVASLLGSGAAFGANYTWNVPGAGPTDWNNGANWTPAGGPPGTTVNVDNALIDNGGTATIDPTGFGSGPILPLDDINFDGGATGGTINQLSGSVSLTGTGTSALPNGGPGSLLMGTNAAAVAGATNTYNIQGGSFQTTGVAGNNGGYVYIGETGGSGAPLSTFIQGTVGDAGTTNVTIGSTTITGSRLEIGGGQSATGGNGKYILNSGTLTLNGNGVGMELGRVGAGPATGSARGELDVNGGTLNAGTSGSVNTSDVYLGRGTGTAVSNGFIEQTGGAVNIGVRSNNNLILGMAADGYGQYDLSGGVLTVGNYTATPPTNDSNGGALILGNATPATAGKVTGVMNISANGDLEAPGFATLVGNANGATGTINQTGGVAHFGQSTNAARLILGNSAGTAASFSTGNYVYSGGQLTANGLTVAGGAFSHGTFTQSNGTIANFGSAGANMLIANGANSVGGYTLSGAGTVLFINARMDLGSGGTGSNGTFTMGAGTELDSGEMRIGAGAGGTGTVTQNGGTANIGDNLNTPAGWTVVGNADNATGTYNLHGGVLNTTRITVANAGVNSTGNFIQDGGVANVQNGVVFGWGGNNTGNYTISGPSSGPNAVVLNSNTTVNGLFTGGSGNDTGTSEGMTIGNTTNGPQSFFNQNGGAVNVGQLGNTNGVAIGHGTYNLSGGVLTTPGIYGVFNGAISTFNFNGGVVVAGPGINGGGAAAPSSPFMGPGNTNAAIHAVSVANVQAGGAIIDPQGFNITISQNLRHDPALGATADGGLTLQTDSVSSPGTLTLSGTNTFTGDTNVTATGPSGANDLLILGSTQALGGSTLNMTINSGPGAASPMVQFAPGVVSFTLGGLKGAANLALPDTGGAGITLSVGNNNQNTTYTGVLSDTGPATASGLTKIGTGTLHLTAVQAYTGPTFVSNGTLSLNGASIAASSAVQVGGPLSTGPAPTLLAQNGANAGNVTVGPIYGTFGPGDVNTANANSLTINNGGALAFTLGSSSSPNSDLIAVTNALTLPAAGGVAKVNFTDNANAGGLGSMGLGTYKIITAGSIVNFSATSFAVGSTPLAGDSYTFTEPNPNEIDVTISLKSWTGAATPDSNWSNAGNWLANAIPGATGGSTTNSDTADFNGAGNGNTTVTVDPGRNVAGITFETAAAAYTIGSLGPNGGSPLLLTNGGTIQTTSAVANDQIVNAPLVLEGANGSYTFASNSATNLLNFGGGITGGAAGATVLTLAGSSTGANTISGAIGNGSATTVALFKSGAGTWVLSGNNTFTGGVTIDGGTLRVGSLGALNSAAPNTVTFTNITTGTLALNGFNITVGGLSGATATGTVNNGSAASTATLTVNSGATPNSFSGLLADGGAKALNLTLSSAAGGDLTLTNANTFSGVTNVTGAGTIILANANALQNSTLNVTVPGNSVQFPAGLTPFTIGGLSGPAGLVLQDTQQAAITLNIGNNNQNTQYDGVLSQVTTGSGINKVGTGTLSLSQAPTYTGTTRVSAGTLAFDPPAGPALVMASQITGPGVVAATGPGALTLTNGNNTFSGGLVVSPGVTVTAGPWQSGATDPLGAGAVTLNAGSTLNLAGSAAAAVPPPFDPTQTYRAPLTLAGDSTVNVTGSAAATMGTLRTGAKLSVTGDPGSSLAVGVTTLTGPATFNPAANTTLNLGPVGENPAGQKLSKTGAGTLVMNAPGTYTGGTAISNGILQVGNNSALGTSATSAIGMTGGTLRLGLVPRFAIGLNCIGNIGYNPAGAGSMPTNAVAGYNVGNGFPISNWNNFNAGGASGLGNFVGTQVLSNFSGGNPNLGIATPIANTIVDSHGIPTGATMSYSTTNNGWSVTQNLGVNATPDAALMNGYLETASGDAGTPTRISISGLPAGKTFNVFAYVGGFNGDQGNFGFGSLAQVAAGPGSAAQPWWARSNTGQVFPAPFIGYTLSTATNLADATTQNGANVLEWDSVSPGASTNPNTVGSANSIDFIWNNHTGGNMGVFAIEFVDAATSPSSASVSNALNITGNATVDVTGGTSGGVTGAMTIGSNTLFVTGQSDNPGVDPYTLTLGAATLNGNPTFDVANNGTGLGTAKLASLNDGGSARVITKANAGTLEIDGASNLTGGAPGTSFLVNSGTLRFKNTAGPATIGAGVSVTVASAATLELAGSVSDLSSTTSPLTRAHVINNSKQASGGSLLVSGTNQQVGAVDGIGDTVVNAGANLTADHIVQNALVIGGSATSGGKVTIAPSDASGNPTASGLAVAGALASSDPFGSGTSSSLAADGSSDGGGSGLGAASDQSGGSSAVPEPSTLLLALGFLACLWPALRRRGTRSRNQ